MTVREHALRVLTSPQARRIRFQYTGFNRSVITVAPETFERVTAAIRSNRILLRGPVDLNPIDTGMYVPDNGVDAAGHPYSGAFSLRDNTFSRIWDVTLIHESVHAS